MLSASDASARIPKLMSVKYFISFPSIQDFEIIILKSVKKSTIILTISGKNRFSFCAFHPDILIVDEILGVGDFRFQEKCQKKIQEMMSGGTTVLFVSHSIEQIRNICSKAIILEHGKLIAQGDVNEVCDTYLSMY